MHWRRNYRCEESAAEGQGWVQVGRRSRHPAWRMEPGGEDLKEDEEENGIRQRQAEEKEERKEGETEKVKLKG